MQYRSWIPCINVIPDLFFLGQNKCPMGQKKQKLIRKIFFNNKKFVRLGFRSPNSQVIEETCDGFPWRRFSDIMICLKCPSHYISHEYRTGGYELSEGDKKILQLIYPAN